MREVRGDIDEKYIRNETRPDAVSRAKAKFFHRTEFEQRMEGTGNQVESMLDAELRSYLDNHPEYDKGGWCDDENDCKVVPDRSNRFYPSKQLREFAKENGFKLTRATSKYVPDYEWYVAPVSV